MSKISPVRLPFSIKLGWAIGELGIAVYIGVTMTFFLFYLTNAHEISPVWAGIILVVPRVLDALFDPLIGAISDRTKSRMGRRRPYLLAGSLLYGVGFYCFLAMPEFSSETAKIAYAITTYMFASFAFSLMAVPYTAMTAEMTTNYKERTELVAYRMVAARVGIIGAGVLTPLIYATQTSLADGFRLVGLLLGGFMAISGLVTFFATKDAPQVEQIVRTYSLKDEMRAIVQNRPFMILFFVFLCQNIAIGATATTLVYYLTYAMRVEASMIGPLLAVAGITATVFTPPWVLVSKNFDKPVAYTMALSVTCLMALPAFFLPAHSFLALFAIYFMAAVGDAGNQLLSNSMVPDTVEVDELKTGERREGAIFGAWAFCLKLGMASGAFLVSVVLGWSGFSGEALVQTPDATLGIRLSYSVLPFILWVAAIVLLRKYRLNEEHFNEVKSAIQKRG